MEQETTFWYLFGVKEADCYSVIEPETGRSVLFVPRHPEAYKMWMYVKPTEEFIKDYKVDKVLYTDEIETWLQDYKPTTTYLFSGTDSDSGLKPEEPEEKYLQHCGELERETLWKLISNLRAIKTEQEIDLMRYVIKVASDIHIKVMKSTKVGLTQRQMQNIFHFEHSIKTDCPLFAYAPICSSGRDCATLHYIENDKVFKPGQMCLFDMGGKWAGYCADLTVTFPVDGKFTEKQKNIYNAVYYAHKAVLETAKEGVNWTDMHLLAEKIILENLIKIGIVNEAPMEELVEKRIGAIFFPHGLGHFLGLRVHDLGGYTEGHARSDKVGLRSLRTRRDLLEGMVITVEPGCYFIDFIIKNALEDPDRAKYLNAEKIEEYMEVGGVRLEDNVVIRKDGIENLCSIPRKWEDVEKILNE